MTFKTLFAYNHNNKGCVKGLGPFLLFIQAFFNIPNGTLEENLINAYRKSFFYLFKNSASSCSKYYLMLEKYLSIFIAFVALRNYHEASIGSDIKFMNSF